MTNLIEEMLADINKLHSKGISYSSIFDEAGVHISQLRLWREGLTTPRLDTFLKIKTAIKRLSEEHISNLDKNNGEV